MIFYGSIENDGLKKTKTESNEIGDGSVNDGKIYSVRYIHHV